MAAAVDTLNQFITRAERDRKYAPNTAAGLRAALNMFASAMNEEEKESLEVLEAHLEPIYNEVYRQKSGKMSSQSLQTYYTRVKRVLHDHNTYGADPIKMATWNPQRRSRASKPKAISRADTPSDKQAHRPSPNQPELHTLQAGINDRFEISFGHGRALLLLPAQRNEADILKLKRLVDFLEATAESNEGKNEETRAPEAQI